MSLYPDRASNSDSTKQGNGTGAGTSSYNKSTSQRTDNGTETSKSSKSDSKPVEKDKNVEGVVHSWLFSESTYLNETPSRVQFRISREQELVERDHIHQFIVQVGSKLKLDRSAILAASIYANRFYMRIPIKRNSKFYVACGALAISCKLHDNYRPPDKIALQAAIVATPDRVVDEQSPVYWTFKDQLLYREELILKTLNFELNVTLPYEIRDQLVKDLSSSKYALFYSKKEEIFKYSISLIELLSSLPIFLVFDTYTIFGTALIIVIYEARSKLKEPGLKLPENYLRIKLQVDSTLCYSCFQFILKLLEHCVHNEKVICNKAAKQRIKPIPKKDFIDVANETILD
ncbi:uncharacterized protein RJT21DRAFT_120325 [Scheffersomyces amazonensis]|uniref:uncharacterized protein n=1 Tax=Scheffersomyces amazonensis TaxID=1078765 RepID=UPI00315C7574